MRERLSSLRARQDTLNKALTHLHVAQRVAEEGNKFKNEKILKTLQGYVGEVSW